jgi:dihydrofolate reductase
MPAPHRSLLSMALRKAITAVKEFAGDRDVDVAAGQIGGQALKLGLIDQVVINQVPVIFGSGRPFFATGALAEPLLLESDHDRGR